jgi:hypothetical protein
VTRRKERRTLAASNSVPAVVARARSLPGYPVAHDEGATAPALAASGRVRICAGPVVAARAALRLPRPRQVMVRRYIYMFV